MILSRDERQDLCITKWKEAGGRATVLAATGFGKTRIALKTIKRVLDKKKDYKVLIVVPSDYLRLQWIFELAEWGMTANTTVTIINTAIKTDQVYDLVICDEVHLFVAETFVRVFAKVKYKLILCLTGTIDRLDGKQVLLEKYAPICDTITLDEAIKSNWVADYKQYKVLIDVDLTDYKKEHTKFLHHFSYFGYDFNLAMKCVTDFQARNKFARDHGQLPKDVMLHAIGFIKSMKARKSFIYDHPKKIEIANKIINARLDKKIITFTKSVEHAKSICCGEVYHAKVSKKKKAEIMKQFNDADFGVINTCKALDVGADVKGVNTAIIISGDSSSITKRQKIGRAIRKEEEKVAELWQFVIKGTVEEEWFRKSSEKLKYTTIDEQQLDDFLEIGSYEEKRHVEKGPLLFRF